MDSRFTNAEFFSSLTDSSIRIYDKISDLDGTFFYVIFQIGIPPYMDIDLNI